MPVSVKEYMESMESVSSSINPQKSKVKMDIQQQALLANLIDAIGYAKSMDFKKKALNNAAPNTNETGQQVLDTIKAQEDLIDQLAEGQELSKEQSQKLIDAIDKFYEFAGTAEINYKKFAEYLEKTAIERQNLPEAVQTRLINDSRDAHMIGKEQQDSANNPIMILKRIKNILEDSFEMSKQFGKKLFVTLDDFKEGLLGAFDGLKEAFEDNGFLSQLADVISSIGMAWMIFSRQFAKGDFKWGQLFKQFKNIQTAFKTFGQLSKMGVKVKGPIKAIKDLVTGAKLIGKGLADIPKAFKGLKSFGAIGKTLGRGVTKGLGKGVAKKIPVVGSIISIWMMIERWKKGDYLGAFLELGSGIAAVFPGIGTLISIGIDLINLGRDTGAFAKAGNFMMAQGKKVLGNMSETMLMSLPAIGPIFGIMKAIKLFKSGNKKGGLIMVGKALAAFLPGGAVIADLAVKLLGLDKFIKPEPTPNNPGPDGNSGFGANKNNKLLNKMNAAAKKQGIKRKAVKQKEGTSGTKVDDYEWVDYDWSKDKEGKGLGFASGVSNTFNADDGKGDPGSKKMSSTEIGNRLGQASVKTAKSMGGASSTHYCAKGVSNTFRAALGESIGGHAYQMTNALKNSAFGKKYFNYKGKASKMTFKKGELPAGTVLGWSRYPGNPYGHIEVSDGKDLLSSDFYRKSSGILGSGYKRNNIKPDIFVPKGATLNLKTAKDNVTSTSADASEENINTEVEQETPQTFEDIMKAFTDFNKDLEKNMPSAAAVSQVDTMSAPSTDDVLYGMPTTKIASQSAKTAESLANLPERLVDLPRRSTPAQQSIAATRQAPTIQPAINNTSSSALTTEINDTDLALLNSLLFQ